MLWSIMIAWVGLSYLASIACCLLTVVGGGVFRLALRWQIHSPHFSPLITLVSSLFNSGDNLSGVSVVFVRGDNLSGGDILSGVESNPGVLMAYLMVPFGP